MRLTWLFNMQLPISQSNKSRKWCWWIYGIRKEKKRMITHWRFRRSLEITFELCFSSFTGIFSSLLFLSSFYCATRSRAQQRRWFFYFPLRILLHERVRVRATKSCHAVHEHFCILFYAFQFLVHAFPCELQGWKILERGFQCVSEYLMRFYATKQPFPTRSGCCCE